MRILIPITNFGRGGGARVLSRLATAWTSAGHQVDFLVDSRSPPPYFPTDAGVHKFDPRGLVEGPAKTGATFANSGNAAAIYLGMYHGLNTIGSSYDVILANHSLTAWPVHFARTGAARKFYYVQAFEPEFYLLEPGWKPRVLRQLSQWSYSLALNQIANAPIYVGHESIRAKTWIPPGLDVSVFHRRATMPTFLSDDSPIVVGTIGRKEATKGTIHVLEAFTRLYAMNPRFRLRVAFGNLPDAWSHPGAEIVTPQSDEELAAYYRSVDILVAPGTVQLGACHYPVLEAMASGTPVITTGYMPASADNSWLVPVGDSEAVAQAVLAVVATPPTKLSERLDLAHAAVQRFSWRKVSHDFLDLFANAAALR
jgi:glycosyltransferase involved in cell wall biosynthesis